MNGVPEWETCASYDNTPVPVPAWLAERCIQMLERYLSGTPRTLTPCYAAEEEEEVKDLKRLYTWALTGVDPADRERKGGDA